MNVVIKSLAGHVTVHTGQGGYPVLTLAKAGDTHTFATEHEYRPYQGACQGLQAAGALEITVGHAKAEPVKAPEAKIETPVAAPEAPKAEEPTQDKVERKGKNRRPAQEPTNE